MKNNKDLQMDDLIINHTEMATNPIISVILSNFMINKDNESVLDLNSLNRIILNCYNSHFPSFELIISNDLFNNLNKDITNKQNIQVIDSNSNKEFKNKAIDKSKGDFLFFIEEDILFSPILFKKMFDKINNNDYDWVLFPMDPIIDLKFSKNDQYDINEFSKRKTINSNLKYDYLSSDKLFKKKFLKNIDFKFSDNLKNDIQTLYNKGNYKKFNAHYILTTDSFLNDPFISIIIDDIKIKKEELEDLLKSIYNQSFKSFDIYLNETLQNKVSNKYLSMNNLNFLKNNNFKETAVKESKSKYAIFVDIPVIYNSSFLEKSFLKIEEANNKQNHKNFSFLSTPICTSNNKKIYNFSTQELAYFYKNVSSPSNKSKFLIFDLYLANKLINLDYLRRNKIYFNNCNSDILRIYRTSNSVRTYEKFISTNLSQKEMFKSSFKNEKVPFSDRIFYNVHKMFLILLYIREILNGEK
ncbi:glycosyltransferase [Methanobrevibacter arboriphilus]|uniref:glycosyltransferase n=1 Tax=Methanobrevibacter arboriphilus TaxID=39441 RepID=UPI0005B2539C|nr:glycosyltransferase [Methanobrevibacter arboriphilus]